MIFHSEKLSTYRFCDNVWTFLLKVDKKYFCKILGNVSFPFFKDVEFRQQNQEVCRADKVKIVACDAKSTYLQVNTFFKKQYLRNILVGMFFKFNFQTLEKNKAEKSSKEDK